MYSLPDWAFYPIATALAAGMVVTAMSFGESGHRTPEEIRAEGIAFADDSLAALTLGNGLAAEFLTDEETQFARISAARGPFDGIQSAGAFFTLSEDEIEALEGHRVRLTFAVRAAEIDGAEQVRFNLFIPGRSQGDWQVSPVTSEFTRVTLDLTPAQCEWGFAYVALWPDWTTDHNQIDLERVEISALEPVPCDG